MASILQFARDEGTKKRRPREPGETIGEVVIFPGIRIERHEEPDEMPAQALRKQASES